MQREINHYTRRQPDALNPCSDSGVEGKVADARKLRELEKGEVAKHRLRSNNTILINQLCPPVPGCCSFGSPLLGGP